ADFFELPCDLATIGMGGQKACPSLSQAAGHPQLGVLFSHSLQPKPMLLGGWPVAAFEKGR
ncbi:hypothetical protein ACLBXB_23785, partial [Methylobacterium mesophilicum]